VIAAPSSGSGKSMVASGLMAAFAARKPVQGFKVGPDYIDPMYHAAATGRPARNLDTWMLPPEAVAAGFVRASSGAELAVIEGVMGLFDGSGDGPLSGTTAEVARLLDAPIVLVVDCARMAGSVAAVVHGFHTFVPGVELAGVIGNRVGSERHAAQLRRAVEALGLPVLGLVPRRSDLAVPERHLGLYTVVERPEAVRQHLVRLAEVVARHIDLAALERIAASAPPLPEPAAARSPGAVPAGPPVRIAVAQDEAFCFSYEDNLDALRAHGADIVPFSPIHDARLPAGIGGIHLGGGYPELYAAQLSANAPMRDDLLLSHRRGMPIYAECGGLMTLTEGVELDTGRHPLVGAIPGWCSMGDRLHMGYREVEVAQAGLLGTPGSTFRGHEFHYSSWASPDPARAAYRVTPRAPGERPRLEGHVDGNLLASYVHLHFGQDPALARRLVDACRAWLRATSGVPRARATAATGASMRTPAQ
jgi:cobyrinic acid a,c-diamide synthase